MSKRKRFKLINECFLTYYSYSSSSLFVFFANYILRFIRLIQGLFLEIFSHMYESARDKHTQLCAVWKNLRILLRFSVVFALAKNYCSSFFLPTLFLFFLYLCHLLPSDGLKSSISFCHTRKSTALFMNVSQSKIYNVLWILYAHIYIFL